MEVGVLPPEKLRTLWQWYLRSVGGGDTQVNKGPRPLGQQADYCVILDAALTVATNSKTGASSALATICTWDVTAEEFTETTKQITVWNHSEATAHAEDTFGVARWIAGHWWFFGDCAAMASR